MAAAKSYATEQEEFWAGAFGAEYSKRNSGGDLVASNAALFTRILKSTVNVKSILEFGCNIGLNLEALRRIDDQIRLTGLEINQGAADVAAAKKIAQIECCSVLERISPSHQADLTFTKGVLIHINPDVLRKVYQNLYDLSKRYILACEYYNPTPVSIPYRGQADRLFKRDFAGELMDGFGLRLVDYGFVYHRDPVSPLDDPTWFLLEKA
jgi:pseudaminic acid biosynthesis-associated methylase